MERVLEKLRDQASAISRAAIDSIGGPARVAAAERLRKQWLARAGIYEQSPIVATD